VVTAGGSAYFDEVVDVLGRQRDWSLILRSGCYVTTTTGCTAYRALRTNTPAVPALEPALEAWAPVLSGPARNRGAGNRAPGRLIRRRKPVVLHGRAADGTTFDSGGRWSDGSSTSTRACQSPPGPRSRRRRDLPGISHPCTTFDKWRWIPVLDAEDRITDVVRTFF